MKPDKKLWREMKSEQRIQELEDLLSEVHKDLTSLISPFSGLTLAPLLRIKRIIKNIEYDAAVVCCKAFREKDQTNEKRTPTQETK